MSDNAKIRPPESYSASPEAQSLEKSPQKDSREVKEAARGGKEALHAIEFGESVESVGSNGEVSEANSSRKDAGSQGTISGMTYSQVKAALLNNIPVESKMRAQIKTEIEKEIKYLHKKAMKMVRKRDNFFELNNVMKKIRELKEILAMLAKAGYEAMKTLWLRFVHGVM
ncbi:hypothetical protein COY05_02725 [Candidatus Peregrinibacteria bacterium CG_4_10_14_0_2_um_filter_38_24]|nr:MAG: hypothetical protein COY05_02725 [Candidatus Peregrinibacteria bacterium CG_4_10_14_0_2_um_filter_38_24]